MYIATTIPENVLDRVRSGAHDALREPLTALSELIEHHPDHACTENTNELLAQIRRAIGLLHLVGWNVGDAMPERVLDTDDYGPALCEALSEAARVATVELREAAPSDRWEVVQGILPLSRFAAVVEAACLERAGRDPGVHIFQESLQVLLGELERDGQDAARVDCLADEPIVCPVSRRVRRQECPVQTR